MTAFYYATSTTDLVRPNNTPLINYCDKGLYGHQDRIGTVIAIV